MITAETIDRIIRFDGHELPVVSVYVGIDADPGARNSVPTRVNSLLDRVRPLAKDSSLAHETRLSVRGDLERIEAAADQERWRPGGMAVFSCTGAGLFEEVPLPRAVRDRSAVDLTPYVRPMLAVLDEYHRTCVVLIDRGDARVWELYQEEMRAAGSLRDRTLRKPNYAAGLAEDRVRNKADELAKRHYRRVVELLDGLLRTDGYDLLIIGGHPYEVPGFVDFLPHELRQRLTGTFTVDPATATTADIRREADAIAERHERAEERSLVAEVLGKVAAGGLAVAGLRPSLWAGTVAAVQTLLVQDGAVVPGVVCDQSGWLALSGSTCPFCGNPTRPAPDVIDELVEAVIDEGGSIRHVEEDTDLKEYLVAAALRFPLPPEPPDA